MHRGKFLKVVFFTVMVVFYGCSTNPPVVTNNAPQVPTPKSNFGGSHKENSELAVLWQQTSAEYRALAYQAYNFSKLMLDIKLSNKEDDKPAAVILDIDETVLDNSPYNAKLIETDKDYSSKTWKKWSDLAEAELVPGAKDFIEHAMSRNVKVFYISNRKVNELDNTIRNLQKLGFTNLDENNFLLRDDTSGKKDRRQVIEETHDVLLLIGDNLNDFSEVFEKATIAARKGKVDSLKHKFGYEFIVLPNPMYGEWEGAIYNYNYDLPEEAKDSLRKVQLKVY